MAIHNPVLPDIYYLLLFNLDHFFGLSFHATCIVYLIDFYRFRVTERYLIPDSYKNLTKAIKIIFDIFHILLEEYERFLKQSEEVKLLI